MIVGRSALLAVPAVFLFAAPAYAQFDFNKLLREGTKALEGVLEPPAAHEPIHEPQPSPESGSGSQVPTSQPTTRSTGSPYDLVEGDCANAWFGGFPSRSSAIARSEAVITHCTGNRPNYRIAVEALARHDADRFETYMSIYDHWFQNFRRYQGDCSPGALMAHRDHAQKHYGMMCRERSLASSAEPTKTTGSTANPSAPSTPRHSVEQRSHIELVFEAQDRLNKLGYAAGPVDGAYGPRTARAIEAFQRANGLAQDGRVTPELIASLRAAEAGHSPATAAAPPTHAAPQTAGAVVEYETAPEPTYRALLKLYMAANADNLDNDGAAWEHYLVFRVPPAPNTHANAMGKECLELSIQSRDEFARRDNIERARDELRATMSKIRTWPETGVFRMKGWARLGEYDFQSQAFPLSTSVGPSFVYDGVDVYITRDYREHGGGPYRGPIENFCAAPFTTDAQELDSLRKTGFVRGDRSFGGGPFILKVDGGSHIGAIPMAEGEAEAYSHEIGNDRVVEIAVIVETAPPGSDFVIPARIIAARVLDRRDGRVLHAFNQSLFSRPPDASASAGAAQPRPDQASSGAAGTTGSPYDLPAGNCAKVQVGFLSGFLPQLARDDAIITACTGQRPNYRFAADELARHARHYRMLMEAYDAKFKETRNRVPTSCTENQKTRRAEIALLHYKQMCQGIDLKSGLHPSSSGPGNGAPTTSDAAETPSAEPRTQKELVFESQDRLNRLGYDAGPVDGSYGPRTARAIEAFQRANGLVPDGQVTPQLIAELRAAGAGQAPAPTVVPPTRTAAPAAPQPAATATDYETTPEPTYRAVLKLYMAEHADILDTDAVAWEHYLVFHIPPGPTPHASAMSKECLELLRQSDDEFARRRNFERARRALRAALMEARTWPKTGVFKLKGSAQLAEYDFRSKEFPLRSHINPSFVKDGVILAIARHLASRAAAMQTAGGLARVYNGPTENFCRALPFPGAAEGLQKLSGIELLPSVGGAMNRMFVLSVDGGDAIRSIPMTEPEARAYLEQSGGKRDVAIEVIVEAEAPGTNFIMPARIVAARALDPRSGRVLHDFREDLVAGGTGVAPAMPAVATQRAEPSGNVQQLRRGGNGIIPIRPHLIEGVAGFSLLEGGNADFGRYLTLAHIGSNPDLLDDPNNALFAAATLLDRDHRRPYVCDHEEALQRGSRDCSSDFVHMGNMLLQTSPVPPVEGWRGADEFQLRRSIEAFLNDWKPRLTAAAPKPPFDVALAARVNFGRYDHDRNGFGLSFVGGSLERQMLRFDPGGALSTGDFKIRNRLVFPEFLEIGPGPAESVLRKLEGRHGYAVARYTVHTVSQRPGPFPVANLLLDAELRSLTLYADRDLTAVIHRFDQFERRPDPEEVARQRAAAAAAAKAEQEARLREEQARAAERAAEEKRRREAEAAAARRRAAERAAMGQACERVRDYEEKIACYERLCRLIREDKMASVQELMACAKNIEGLQMAHKQAARRAKREAEVATFQHRMSCQNRFEDSGAPAGEIAEAVEACMTEKLRVPYGPDMLGLRLGMEMGGTGDAEARTRYKLGISPHEVTSHSANAKDPRPFDRGMLYVSGDANHGIALFSLKNRDRERVAAISRRLYFEGDMTAGTIVEGLRTKYGRETWSDGERVLLWAFPERAADLPPDRCAPLAEELEPRGNWTSEWRPKGADKALQSALDADQARRQARLDAYVQCTNAAAMAAGADPGHGEGHGAEAQKIQEALAACERDFGAPEDEPAARSAMEEPRRPMMIGPEGDPRTFAQFERCGPVLITHLNADDNGTLADASFVLFDPGWIAERPAFAFKRGAGGKAAAESTKIDF